LQKYILIILAIFIVGCENKKNIINGYIDADLTYISSEFGGKLSEINISRGSFVSINQPLFKLEQTYESLSVKISDDSTKKLFAQKEEIASKIKYAKINLERTLNMQKKEAASADELDIAKMNLAVLNEQLNTIDAEIKQNSFETAQKEWKKSQKESIAPISGFVFDTYFTKGEFVNIAQPVLSLVAKENIKVIFFAPEDEVGNIKLNQSVKVFIDGAKEPLFGSVSYISNIAEYTPPIIFSREERQKLVFKVEVKLKDIDLNKMHLGQPVSLELEK
jgi:HlyD family secretion protein